MLLEVPVDKGMWRGTSQGSEGRAWAGGLRFASPGGRSLEVSRGSLSPAASWPHISCDFDKDLEGWSGHWAVTSELEPVG